MIMKNLRKCKTTNSFPALLNIPPPSELNPDTLIEELYKTGWLTGLVHKLIHPLDRRFFDDYHQSVLEELLKMKDRIYDCYTRGAGLMVNYIKTIVKIQLKSINSNVYKNNRYGSHVEFTLDDNQWSDLIESGSSTYTDSYGESDGEWHGKRYRHNYYLRTEDEPCQTYFDLYEEDS